MNRTKLEAFAETLNYEMTPASPLDRMDAANQGEPVPRWTLNPVGNVWNNNVKHCATLADVAEELDRIEILKA